MKELHYYRGWWYAFSTICALLGVGFAIFENEVLWSNANQQNTRTVALKLAVLVSSAMAAGGLQRQMSARLRIRRLRGEALPEQAGFWINLYRAGLLSEFVTDLALLAIIPIPFVDFHVEVWDAGNRAHLPYTTDALLCGIMVLVRVRYILVCLTLLDPLASAASAVYARTAGVDLSLRFILATRCKRNFRFLLFLWLLAIFITAYCMMVAERPYDSDPIFKNEDVNQSLGHMDQFHNCLWLVVITMTTVGYGDVYPSTDLGRFIAVASCFEAVVLLALCIDVVNLRLSLDDPSDRLVSFTYRVREYKGMRVAAVKIIERLYLLSPIYRRLHPEGTPRAKRCDEKIAATLRRRWKELDQLGLGVLGDVELMHLIRVFRKARRAFDSRENVMKTDLKLQLSEMTDRMGGLETEVEKLVGELQLCLHKLSAKL
eukprot:CAMPEP_0206211768 /NCGR_PEP_ID=MMETSP0047_2-20121206/177_1 /ASSEMBLY_ACC=CAM_ASM_000192 /TAXON_ID=195065 /ORGANISM="Chroomonas mesostigmatica_cf, Strain CCMP1168" /LENGTH=430 /DNA_ID=CAMNT_0053633697 /DNA_START=120 /DNA_END=1412 /DNA_ORIENTATION=+